jgi:hypothetical protein
MTRARFAPVVVALALLALPAAASAHGKARDSDHDGMPNQWEQAHHLKVHKADANGDPDKDGLRNLAEYKLHSDPQNPDSNANGVPDGSDVAGTVASFTNGVLVITLPDGSTRSGTVTTQTQIECKPAAPTTTPTPVARAARDGGGDNGDDQGGQGRDSAQSTTQPSTTQPGTTQPPGANGEPDDDNNNVQDDENDDQGDDAASCGPNPLTPGAKVHEAELSLTSAGATWGKVELLK